MRGQIYEIFRQLYEEKIGGADLGDVFGIIGDVLTLVLADVSGLTKAGNVLGIQVKDDGGIQITSDGVLAKLISTGGLQSALAGLSVKFKTGGTLTSDGDGIYSTVGEAFKVGGYYFNSTGVNPTTELGYGTWVQVAQGLLLMGAP